MTYQHYFSRIWKITSPSVFLSRLVGLAVTTDAETTHRNIVDPIPLLPKKERLGFTGSKTNFDFLTVYDLCPIVTV